MATKEMKTRKELEQIVMREAKASGKCADLQSVIILGLLIADIQIGTLGPLRTIRPIRSPPPAGLN